MTAAVVMAMVTAMVLAMTMVVTMLMRMAMAMAIWNAVVWLSVVLTSERACLQLWAVFVRRSLPTVVDQLACPFLSWNADTTAQSDIMVVQSAALEVPSVVKVAQKAASQALIVVRNN